MGRVAASTSCVSKRRDYYWFASHCTRWQHSKQTLTKGWFCRITYTRPTSSHAGAKRNKENSKADIKWWDIPRIVWLYWKRRVTHWFTWVTHGLTHLNWIDSQCLRGKKIEDLWNKIEIYGVPIFGVYDDDSNYVIHNDKDQISKDYFKVKVPLVKDDYVDFRFTPPSPPLLICVTRFQHIDNKCLSFLV